MRHSHTIIYCILILTICFIKCTGQCCSTVSCVPSHCYNLQGRAPRRALYTYQPQQHKTGSAKIPDDRQSSINKGSYTKAEPVESADDGHDNDELIYHIDYHGVTTHPAPNPKHPRP